MAFRALIRRFHTPKTQSGSSRGPLGHALRASLQQPAPGVQTGDQRRPDLRPVGPVDFTAVIPVLRQRLLIHSHEPLATRLNGALELG